MSLTLKDVQGIAHLARIEVTAEEAQTTLTQLNDIFALIGQMQRVDTSDVQPLTTPLAAISELSLRLRDDVVTESNQREAYQQPAPMVQDGLYLVPKVIE